MKEDIHYTNLMLKLEKLEEKIGRLEKILLSDPTKEKSITPKDFSNFLEFHKEKTVDFKNFGSFHLGAVADSEETKYGCIWENLREEDRTKPMGISCPCKKCSAYSMS